ncbi:MAG: nucleoside hydrolase [Oscillospiraceae bacterium]|nr:nucleoside hydrolase [Oscillospiraceae bacterium]
MSNTIKRRKLILDVDTGSDDAVAIMAAALAPQLDLVAVCTTWGNQPVHNTTENTLRVMRMIGKSTPVYKGSPDAMVKHLSFSRLRDGRINKSVKLDDGKILRMHPDYLEIPPSDRPFERRDACSFYVDYLMHATEKITLVAVGPMSNLGVALTMEPRIAEHIEEIVIMGGGSRQANCTSCAESNIWHDPEAAQKVIGCGAKVTIVPLDATHKGAFGKEHCAMLRALHTRTGDFAAEMAENRMLVYNKTQPLHKKDLSPVHDALCIAYLIDPTVLTDVQFCRCDIDCGDGVGQGQTIVDPRYFTEEKNVYFAFGADPDKFASILCELFK